MSTRYVHDAAIALGAGQFLFGQQHEMPAIDQAGQAIPVSQ